jgi:hypothetical protein
MLKTKKQVKNGEWFRDQIRAFLIRNGATEQLNKAYEFVIITKMGTLQVSGNHHAVLVLRRDAKSHVAFIDQGLGLFFGQAG